MRPFRLVLFGMVAGSSALAQSDSAFVHTVQLPVTEIRPVSDDPEAATLVVPDSLFLLTSKGGSLGDLLMNTTALNLRTYGAQGTLITAGGRGLSADHVQVYWMGVSLNSPSLGLTDLGSIPSALFDGVRLQSGTSLSRSQAGAGAGAIHLVSDKSEIVEAGVSYNQMNNRSNWLRISQTLFKGLHTTTRVNIDRAENDFTFRDPFLIDQPERRQLRNNFSRNAIVQELSAVIRPNLRFDGGLWLQKSQLQIPGLMGGFSEQLSDQRDSSMRVNLSAHWFTNRGKFVLRTARFIEHQSYVQRLSSIHDPHIRSNIATRRSTAQLFWQRQIDRFDFEMGVEYQSEQASSINHEGQEVQRQVIGGQGRLKYKAPNERFSFIAASRYDHGVVGNEPVFDLKLNWKVLNSNIFANGRRIFRYPDLNELYWRPGGNANLSPELGWSVDVGVNKEFQKKNFQGHFSVSAFLQDMSNMIVWFSTGGAIEAQNVNAVQSRGMECSASFTHTYGRIQIRQNAHVTLQKHIGLSDLETTFFPQFQGNYNASVLRESWFLGGAIRTAATTLTPQNLNATRGAQDAVMTADLQAGKAFDVKRAKISIAATCRNLTDVLDYRISRFASPGRVFGMQMNVIIKSPKSNRGI